MCTYTIVCIHFIYYNYYKGNDNPWLQERRKRAESIGEVIRSQAVEKEIEEENKKEEEYIKKELILLKKNEKKEKERLKNEKLKNDKTKEAKLKAHLIKIDATDILTGKINGGKGAGSIDQPKRNRQKKTDTAVKGVVKEGVKERGDDGGTGENNKDDISTDHRQRNLNTRGKGVKDGRKEGGNEGNKREKSVGGRGRGKGDQGNNINPQFLQTCPHSKSIEINPKISLPSQPPSIQPSRTLASTLNSSLSVLSSPFIPSAPPIPTINENTNTTPNIKNSINHDKKGNNYTKFSENNHKSNSNTTPSTSNNNLSKRNNMNNYNKSNDNFHSKNTHINGNIASDDKNMSTVTLPLKNSNTDVLNTRK